MIKHHAKEWVNTGVKHLPLLAAIVKPRLVQHVPRLKSTIVMTRQAVVGLVGSGVRLRPAEAVGVAIRALHVPLHKSRTAIRKLSVRRQVDTGITIIAVLVLRQNVNPQRSGTVMTRRLVLERVENGAGRIVRRLVLHARHHQLGIVMTRHRVRMLGGIGADHIVQLQHALQQATAGIRYVVDRKVLHHVP
jgi:hypothetical protein